MADRYYTAELSKGQGLIQESIAILREWTPGMDHQQLFEEVRNSGILGKATEQRTKDVVIRSFASRYMNESGQPVGILKMLVERGLSGEDLSQIFFLHTARTNLILHDFVTTVYWPSYAAGVSRINRQESLDFIQDGLDRGKMVSQWSESTRTRIARYLLSTMADFALLGTDRAGSREILPVSPSHRTILYLAHELHFGGCGDNGVVGHDDWKLFGLSRRDVIRQIERAGRPLGMIVQDSGELARITWTAERMEDLIDELA